MNTYEEITRSGGFSIVEAKKGYIVHRVEYPPMGGAITTRVLVPYSELIPRGLNLEDMFDDCVSNAYFLAEEGVTFPDAVSLR